MKKKLVKFFKVIVVPILVPAGILYAVWFLLNPNKRGWKNQDGVPVDMANYPLKWLPFGKTVTVEGRDDLSGTIAGRKLTWNNGTFWTY